MLVAYMTSSFPTSHRLCYGRASVNLFSKPFTLHQLCAGPGWAPESGPGHVGCGLPLPLPGASSYLSPGRGLREALPGLGSHPSLFLPLSFSHPLTTTPPPLRAGGSLTPTPCWAPAPGGQVRRKRTTGRKGSCLREVRGTERAALGDGAAEAPGRALRPRARVLCTQQPHLPGP